MTKLVAITGASGLIGSALRDVLSGRGIRFRALVRTPERARTILGADAVVVGCISDPGAVAELCAGSDAIVHLARSTHRLQDICRYDYPALCTIIDAANANTAELHYASSQAVFGAAHGYPPPVLDDAIPPSPTSAYGAMKAAWEWTARAHCTIKPVIYRFPVVVPAHLADAAPWLKYLLFSGFCQLNTENGSLHVRPQDAHIARGGLSFVHVEDVVDTIAANLFRDEARGTVAMLADTEYVGFRDLADLYADLAGRRGLAVTTAWDSPIDRPAAAEAMFRFDAATARTQLGFSSQDGKARLLGKAAEWFTEMIAGALAGRPDVP